MLKRRRKRKKEKNKQTRVVVKIAKIYLGLSLVLWAAWGQFIFG